MTIQKFSAHKKGILFTFLLNAYEDQKELINEDKKSWEEYDAFVFENLSFMDNTGFITYINEIPIGFMSWDPRNHPKSIRIGHNCIINEYKNNGYGKLQLKTGLEIIKKEKPNKIYVTTGNTPFFLPARKMYESQGFKKINIESTGNKNVPEIINYEIKLD